MENRSLALHERTLQPRHFAELRLTSRQSHTWALLMGITEEDRSLGEWRAFSPFEVFRLGVVRLMKTPIDFPLNSQISLFEFLALETTCAEALRSWAEGRDGWIVTDLVDTHRFASDPSIETADLLSNEELFSLHIFNLDQAIRWMIEATLEGGTQAQQTLVVRLVKQRSLVGVKPLVRTRRLNVDPQSNPSRLEREEALQFVRIKKS